MAVIAVLSEYTAWPGAAQGDFYLETATNYRRSHARQAYAYRPSGAGLTREITPVAEGWVGIVVRPPTTSSSSVVGGFVEFLDAGGDVLFSLDRGDDAAFDNISVNAPFLAARVQVVPFGGPLTEVAIAYKIDAVAGYLRVFVNGERVTMFVGDTQGLLGGDVRAVRLSQNSTSLDVRHAFVSEIIVATDPTIGYKVRSLALTAGAVNDWAGTLGDVTGQDFAADGSEITAPGVDDLITLAAADISLSTADYIAGIELATSIRAGSTSAADEVDFLVYASATESGAERVVLTEGYALAGHVWNLDPRTGAPWAEAGANEIELGVATRSS